MSEKNKQKLKNIVMKKNQNNLIIIIFLLRFTAYIKMSEPIKNIKERAEKLIVFEMPKKRIEIIIRKSSEECKTMKTDKIEIVEEIEMEILLLKGRIKIRKLCNDLDEFEIEKGKIKKNR